MRTMIAGLLVGYLLANIWVTVSRVGGTYTKTAHDGAVDAIGSAVLMLLVILLWGIK